MIAFNFLQVRKFPESNSKTGPFFETFESDFKKYSALTGQQFTFLYSNRETNSPFGVLFFGILL
jgi:hypothetical protein